MLVGDYLGLSVDTDTSGALNASGPIPADNDQMRCTDHPTRLDRWTGDEIDTSSVADPRARDGMVVPSDSIFYSSFDLQSSILLPRISSDSKILFSFYFTKY